MRAGARRPATIIDIKKIPALTAIEDLGGGAFRIAHEAAFQAIGWKPEVDMREGLRRLIAWRDSNEGKAA